jgi:predicted anti-sigma-YlaC factor YlaD
MIKYLIKHILGKTLTCRDVSNFLSDYLDDVLDEEVKEQFEEHLLYCRSCAAYLNQFRMTIELAHDDQPPPPPPELVEHTLSFLKSHLEPDS